MDLQISLNNITKTINIDNKDTSKLREQLEPILSDYSLSISEDSELLLDSIELRYNKDIALLTFSNLQFPYSNCIDYVEFNTSALRELGIQITLINEDKEVDIVTAQSICRLTDKILKLGHWIIDKGVANENYLSIMEIRMA